ncbi:hypothetical protein GCM10007978_49640 [Shewanella hanedai]|nr:hypothetical protein GCM10007978_49640 [Shewanella hanedai]
MFGYSTLSRVFKSNITLGEGVLHWYCTLIVAKCLVQRVGK